MICFRPNLAAHALIVNALAAVPAGFLECLHYGTASQFHGIASNAAAPVRASCSRADSIRPMVGHLIPGALGSADFRRGLAGSQDRLLRIAW